MIYFNPKTIILAASITKWAVSKILVTAAICEVLTEAIRQCVDSLTEFPTPTTFTLILLSGSEGRELHPGRQSTNCPGWIWTQPF